jgi:hypothetical protein
MPPVLCEGPISCAKQLRRRYISPHIGLGFDRFGPRLTSLVALVLYLVGSASIRAWPM